MKIALAALAVLTLGAVRPSADLTAVKADLRKLVAAQETYFTKNNSYSQNIGVLALTPAEGVTVKITDYTPMAYTAEGTLKGAEGVSCVMFIGRVAAMPKTAKGKAALAEGEVVCDD